MHRRPRYLWIFSTLFLLLAANVQAAEPLLATQRIDVPIRPDVIQDHAVFITPMASLPQSSWRVRTWVTAVLPTSWLASGYTFQVWNQNNKKVAGFGPKLHTSTLDLRSVDATYATQLRIVLFKTPQATQTPESGSVMFTFTDEPNVRLFVFGGLALILLLYAIVASIRYRFGVRALLVTVHSIVFGQSQTSGQRKIASAVVLIFLFSAPVAVSVGLYSDWTHILYLMIKLPFLFLCAFVLSLAAGFVMTSLFGGRLTLAELAAEVLGTLVVTVLVLVSVSPIFAFQSLSHQPHDRFLLFTIALFGLALLIGLLRLRSVFRRAGMPSPNTAITAWTLIYGVVLLQLVWLLRPWVGAVDPVDRRLPFSRINSGNVFVELSQTINRLSK